MAQQEVAAPKTTILAEVDSDKLRSLILVCRSVQEHASDVLTSAVTVPGVVTRVQRDEQVMAMSRELRDARAKVAQHESTISALTSDLARAREEVAELLARAPVVG
jgi:predicted RNase H-like nuclease (RuvC/YqgF family)